MKNLLPRLRTGLILLVGFFAAVAWGRVAFLLYFIIFLVWSAVVEWPVLTHSWSRLYRYVIGCIYLGAPLVILDWVYVSYQHQNMLAVLYPVLVCMVCDTAAYFGGKLFGRHFAFPKISPRKTYEGVFAAYGSVFAFHLFLSFSQPMTSGYFGFVLRHPIFSGFLVASVAILGDLSISVLKRRAGIKDSGSLFPGHGGTLDRGGSLILVTLFIGILMLFV